jgi:TorA maturation chaperone TorD
MPDLITQESLMRSVDEIDRARAQEYALLATLLLHSPDSMMICRLAELEGDESPIGAAHAALGAAAARVNAEDAAREYLALFAGLKDGGLLPYSSHYLTDTLYGSPLARVRQALQDLGITARHLSEPEDHAAILCEIMAGLANGSIAASAGFEREFFERHLSPWMRRFFVDLERAEAADFYSAVGLHGRTFMDLEAEAFSRVG